MANYKVIAGICYSEKLDKIFNAGEMLTDDDLNEHDIPRLIKEKFIEEISEKEAPIKKLLKGK